MSPTAAEAFAAMERLPLKTFEEIGTRGITVVAPHPDDESLGCGGLIRSARDRGVGVSLVIVSDGAGSHPNSRSYPPERLRGVREAEARAAAWELGVPPSDVHFLREPDRFVPSEGPIVDTLAQIVRMNGNDVIAVTWQEDPHCDHKACFSLAQKAREKTGGRLLAYPIWALALPPDAGIGVLPTAGFRLCIAGERAAKRRAIAAHRSQVGDLIMDDPGGFRLTAMHLALFDRELEVYLEIAP